jgi:hypothetical protein
MIGKWIVHLKEWKRKRDLEEFLAPMKGSDQLAREKKWRLYWKVRWRERRINQIKAQMPPPDKLAQEKVWRNTEVPPTWITPAISAGLLAAAEYSIRCIRPDRLLINMNASWIQHGVQFNFYRTAGLGGYGDYGGKNVELSFDYSPHTWEQLCVVAFHYFDKHSGLCAARKRLHDNGIKTWWAGDSETNRVALNLVIGVNEENLSAVRRLAKEDADAVSAELSAKFDNCFDLFLKQSWGPNSEEWRKLEPVVEWPPPEFRHKPCLKF